jgi:hypothetical protein
MTSKTTPPESSPHEHGAREDRSSNVPNKDERATPVAAREAPSGATPGQFNLFSSESLILAQDERWRHA